MTRAFAATILAILMLSTAHAQSTPTDESDPPNPASYRDGRGDVLAFHIDGIAPKAYIATVRCKNGRIGETPGKVHNIQLAIDQAFAACAAE